MKQENVYTSTQVEETMNIEFEKFKENNKAIYGKFEHQAINDFIQQVKEKINEQDVNLA